MAGESLAGINVILPIGYLFVDERKGHPMCVRLESSYLWFAEKEYSSSSYN